MQGKKRYLALVLFLLLGLITFSFANPDDQLEPVEGNVKKVAEQKDEKRVQSKFEEAKELVEKAEQNPTPEIIAEAEEILEEAQQEQPELVQEEDLVNRLNNTEPATDAAALINAVEKMIDEATKKDDVSAAKTYFDNNNVATVTNNLEDGTVKENLNIRVAYLVKVFADETAPVITGIENNQTTNIDVTLSISDDVEVAKLVTLNEEEIDYKDTFDKEGTYIVKVTDKAQNTTTLTFTIDKTNPKVNGIKNGSHYKEITLDVKDDSEVSIEITKNHTETTFVENGTVLIDDATYKIVVTDKAGNKTTLWTAIDNTLPTISGITNGSYVNKCDRMYVADKYLTSVKVNDKEYKREDFTADKNNENFQFEQRLCAEGTYTITATDKIGNTYTETFTIDKTAPVVTLKGKNKVLEPGHYTYTLKAVIEDDNAYTALLNGKEYVSGTDITARDNYTLVVTDIAGNMTTIEFAIDKDKPKIKGVANKGYYNYDVTPEVTDKNLASVTLNDQEYVLGTPITEEGVYTLVAKDIAGNKSTATFTIDKTAATRVSTDFYVHKLTAVEKVFYTQKDNKVTLNIKVNEELKQIPTFTLHSNGVDYVLTDVLDRGENAPGKWLYQASYVIPEELADGELTFTISNIYDLAGNQTVDITETTNGRRVIVDNTPNRVTQTFYRGSEVEGLNYYLTNGNKIQFNIGFRELLAEPAKVTIGGKEVELKYDKYYVATNSHMYYGYLEAAQDESDLVPGELEVEISNIVDYAGNKGFYYQTNGKKVYDTYKFTATTNGNVAIYKINGIQISTAEQLKNLFSNFKNIKDETVVLTADIDMSEVKDWQPVMGVDTYTFTLEGNNHKISNLTYETNKKYAGLLFEGMDSGDVTINNLTFENCKIESTASGSYVGLIGGYIDVINSLNINNVNIINSEVKSTNYAGALLGWTAGYNTQNDGPVDGIVNINNSSVKGTKVIGGGSAGLAIGHAGSNPGTYTTIKNFVAEDNTIKGEKVEKTGAIIGTANTGEVTLENITYKNNKVYDTENSTKLVGRFVPGSTGKLTHIVDDETEFADAVANALKGQVIVLNKDLSFSDKAMTFAKDKDVTINLNNNDIYARSTEKKAFNFLTVKNGAKVSLIGEGKILYEAGNPDTDWGTNGSKPYPGYANNTIRNEGKLIVNGITIQNNTARGGASYVIDNYAGADLIVEAGTIHQTGGDVAIRLFSGSATTATKVTINGGNITGSRAIWVQLPGSDSKVAPKTEVTVNGGTLTTSNPSQQPAFYSYSFGNSFANTKLVFNGGTFNGDVQLGGGYKGDRENVTVNGGTFNGYLGRWVTSSDWEDIPKP